MVCSCIQYRIIIFNLPIHCPVLVCMAWKEKHFQIKYAQWVSELSFFYSNIDNLINIQCMHTAVGFLSLLYLQKAQLYTCMHTYIHVSLYIIQNWNFLDTVFNRWIQYSVCSFTEFISLRLCRKFSAVVSHNTLSFSSRDPPQPYYAYVLSKRDCREISRIYFLEIFPALAPFTLIPSYPTSHTPPLVILVIHTQRILVWIHCI